MNEQPNTVQRKQSNAKSSTQQQKDLEQQLKEQFGDLDGIDISKVSIEDLDFENLSSTELDKQLTREIEAPKRKMAAQAESKLSEEERISKRRKTLASMIELNVSKDSMIAYLRIKNTENQEDDKGDFEIVADDIINFLKSRDIVFGVREEAIREFCEKKKFYSEIKSAIGKEPVHQQAARLTFEFETEKNIKPKENEDGSVDFKNLGLIQTVKKGQVLCKVILPPEGVDGMDIYGHVVKFKPCVLPNLPAGANTIVSEDKLLLTSAVDGCVNYIRNKVEVQPVFVVKGNVDNSSGDIDFFGSVTVDGDVLEGFTIKAGKEVIVKGIVEGAFIEAGEDVKLLKGMNGMTKGTIKAGGNISGKFFENAILKCDGDIYSDSLLNCQVDAGGSVHLKGTKSVLIGGECRAGSAIFGYNIGNIGGIKTNVCVGADIAEKQMEIQDNLERQADLKREIKQTEENINSLHEKLIMLKDRIAKHGQNEKDAAVFKILLTQKSQQGALLSELNKEMEEIKEKQLSFDFSDMKIIAKSVMHPGVKLSVGPFTMYIDKDFSASKFYAGEDGIEFGPITPADMDK